MAKKSGELNPEMRIQVLIHNLVDECDISVMMEVLEKIFKFTLRPGLTEEG